MTKFKKRLIKIGIIALMPILALLLCLNNTYAYYQDNNGNIVSDNLANIDNISGLQAVNAYDFSFNNQVITITQTVSNSDPYIYFSNFITLQPGSYSMYYLVDTLEVQYIGLTEANTTNFVYYIPYQNYSRITLNSTTSFGLGFEGIGSINRVFNIKIMIYPENEQIDYEPYGTWINSNDSVILNNYGPLYKVLNGTTAKAFNYNETNLSNLLSATPTISETISWTNSYNFSINSIPNIKNAILNGASDFYDVDRPIVLLSFNSPLLIDTLSFYRTDSNEIRYIYLYFYDGSMESVSIANASDFSTKYVNWYNTNDKSISYIAFDCEVNFDIVTTISQPGYEMVYSDAYEKGSSDGYKEGYNDGVKSTNSSAYNSGYNNGFNDGSEQNLETSGMKTLFNSILSYPVNMIKSVFNFEFMGVNIASVIMFVVSIGIVFFVIKKFKE